jgi:bifunctional UDP-N-acetylglucosamine pyrophosphorylase/glucosamine-1-phosphate N-acetyltransferase
VVAIVDKASRERELAVVILAAGKGTRMKSSLVKILHPLAGRPMLAYILDLALSFDPQRIAVVIGYQAETVKKAFKKASTPWTWSIQSEQKGTADAVLSAKPVLKDFAGTLLILYGDVPLLKRSTVDMLIQAHHNGGTPVTILTAILNDPTGYGRIVRDESKAITSIVEELDASSAERTIREINTGIYCMSAPTLFEALSAVDANNVKKEYYLTDVIRFCVEKGYRVGWHETQEPELTLGINTRRDLAMAEARLRSAICDRWMLSGVTIVDPYHTHIDHGVTIGMDTRIEPNCHIRGDTVIGKECVIEPGCVITDSTVGHRVRVCALSVIEGRHIEDGSTVGPLAHVGPRSGRVCRGKHTVDAGKGVRKKKGQRPRNSRT